MATNAETKKVRRVSFAYIQKLMAGVSLLAFLVVAVAGVRANVGVVTIALRAFIVILVVGIVSRLVVQILATYEEMSSGKT